MSRVFAIVSASLLASGLLFAPKTAKKPERVWPEGSAPAGLAIAHVDVAFRGGRARVTTDLTWPRRAKPESFTLFAAYGAPGTPRAFDAELVAVPRDRFAPEPDARGAPLFAAHETRAPREAAIALGPRASAGQTVTVPREREEALEGPQVALRLRAVHELSNDKKKSVLVRVSPADGVLDLGPITVTVDGVAAPNAKAALCDAKGSTPVALPGRPSLPSPAAVARRAGESLCVELAPAEAAPEK